MTQLKNKLNFRTFKEKFQKVPVVEVENNVPSNPLVSVCVQTYQHSPYIRQCLNGILMQEVDFEYEILLGEDASMDGTREICLEYAERYPDKIRLFMHHRKNNIAIGNIPTGRFNFLYNVYSARGKYIAICEGDDYWTDFLKLQKQVELLKKTKSDCCNTLWQELCNGEFVKKGNNKRCSEEGYFMLEKRKMGYFHTSTRLVKKEVLADIMIKYPIGLLADTPLQIILNQYYKVVVLCSYTSVYRISGEGVWTSITKKSQHKAHYEIYKSLAEHIPERRYEFLKKKWNFFFLILTENKVLSRVPKIWFERMARLLTYLERRLEFFNA